MTLKIKIHTEDRSRTPIDIEVEASFDLNQIHEAIQKPEFKNIMDTLSSSIIPSILSRMSGPISSSVSFGTPIGPFSNMPLNPDIMGKILESIAAQISKESCWTDSNKLKDRADHLNDVFKDDKAEPPDTDKYKPAAAKENKKVHDTIKKMVKDKVKEIKIGDGTKDLLKKSYEEIKEGEKEKLFEAARKRIEEMNKPKEDNANNK